MTKQHERSRSELSRSMNTREIDHLRIVQNITQGNRGRFDIDPETTPKNKQYYWARDALLGAPDMHRITELRRKGFSPVPAERHPEKFMHDLPWRKNHMEEYVYDGGLLLMERDIVYKELEDKKTHEDSIIRMNGIPGTDQLMNEPTMPMRNYGTQTGISKMASFSGE